MIGCVPGNPQFRSSKRGLATPLLEKSSEIFSCPFQVTEFVATKRPNARFPLLSHGEKTLRPRQRHLLCGGNRAHWALF